MNDKMVKFVYVLVSSDNDYIMEQAMVSMYSLKHHNPGAHITLVTDPSTYGTLTEERARILDYIDETIIEKTPKEFNPTQKSRFLKTSLRPLVKGNFLYIDTDTIITGSLKELENLEWDLSAVLNRHQKNWKKLGAHPQLRLYYKETGFIPDYDQEITDFYNGGIILSNDTDISLNFFKKWHSLWMESTARYGFEKDQPDMWRANFLIGNPIKKLDGKYNFQTVCPTDSIKFITECRIFHYFSSTDLIADLWIKSPDNLEYIRKNGVDIRIKKKVENILIDYARQLLVLTDIEKNEYYNPANVLARSIIRRFPVLNRISRMVIKYFWAIRNASAH